MVSRERLSVRDLAHTEYRTPCLAPTDQASSCRNHIPEVCIGRDVRPELTLEVVLDGNAASGSPEAYLATPQEEPVSARVGA
jgi:hypothetical protein